MSAVEKNLPLKMSRANLERVPEFALPAGFALRGYQPGDELHWLRIQAAADRYNKISPALFDRQFGSDKNLLSARQCYLLAPAGNAIGTGTAWWDDAFQGGRWGRVHWLAMAPEFQGHGLAKPLMTWVCRQLRELGHDRAYLSTSTARRAAIGLYLRFGFEALILSPEEAAVWRELLPSVGRNV
jgi:GNAT superfamily N-acetyltransferase